MEEKQKREKTLPQLLRKIASSATELAETAELAAQALRQENGREDDGKDRLRNMLQHYLGVQDMLKRVLLDPADREFLINEGYMRKERQ